MCFCFVVVLSFSFYGTVEWARTNAHLMTNGKTTTRSENSKSINSYYYAVFATRFSIPRWLDADVRPE